MKQVPQGDTWTGWTVQIGDDQVFDNLTQTQARLKIESIGVDYERFKVWHNSRRVNIFSATIGGVRRCTLTYPGGRIDYADGE